jgi:ribonuclease P/MRP protein subunit POP1
MAPKASSSVLGKRKQPPHQKTYTPAKRFQVNFAKQSPSQAFPGDALTVPTFMSSLAYEIRALQSAWDQSRTGGARRAFQKVPISLRRRTASHNVKRVPKRLRATAERNMKEDCVKPKRDRTNGLVRTNWLKANALKRARGVRVKKLMDKRKQDTDGGTKIIARQPNPKKTTDVLNNPPLPKARFRRRQQNKTWLPTHLYHAKRAHMTTAGNPLWRFSIPLTPTEKCYRLTHRATNLRGAVAWDMSYMSTIALSGPEKSILNLLKALGVKMEGKVGVKCKNGMKSWEGCLYSRQKYPLGAICPATIIWEPPGEEHDAKRRLLIRFHPSAFLELWDEIIHLSKVQKPALTVEDLRYEIGSIDIIGPGSTEALVNTLRPIFLNDDDRVTPEIEKLWNSIKPLENPSLLPRNALLYFNISDPRLNSRIQPTEIGELNDDALLELSTNWQTKTLIPSTSIHSRQTRLKSTQHLTSHTIVKRRLLSSADTLMPRASDPRIPIAILASPRGHRSTWTVLLPWAWVDITWRALMRVPLSTGGTIRFGGIQEQRQTAYEVGRLWFPGDWPGTKAGIEWEERERKSTKKQWDAHPKGRRTEFDTVDLGNGRKGEIGIGWGCDWALLLGGSEERPYQISPGQLASMKPNADNYLSIPSGALVGVRITMMSKGVPSSRARLYRLPQERNWRDKWLTLLPKSGRKKDQEQDPKIGHDSYPLVPDSSDLIGFVTTGNYNLAVGEGTGIGSILFKEARHMQFDHARKDSAQVVQTLCIVRDVGESFGRLARWEVI